MREIEIIRKNAQLVMDRVGPLSGMGDQFGYNRATVAWIEGYIERLAENTRPTIEAARLSQVFGSWLGECIIRVYGGEWRSDDGTWGVFFDEKNAVYPFRFATKQFESGLAGGDSILSKFDMIGLVMLNQPPAP